tara:strand:+ start:231 stop:443 length:213 start_codon:yes stop_codon:yes gene_type:complete
MAPWLALSLCSLGFWLIGNELWNQDPAQRPLQALALMSWCVSWLMFWTVLGAFWLSLGLFVFGTMVLARK